MASRRDTIIMQEDYAIRFEPWPTARVRACVHDLRNIAIRAASAADARTEALRHADLQAFSERYTVMFRRLTEPETSRNEEHVKTILALLQIHEQMRAGALTETEAKTQASDTALAGLLRQAPGAPKPPEPSVIEELD